MNNTDNVLAKITIITSKYLAAVVNGTAMVAQTTYNKNDFSKTCSSTSFKY